MESIQTFNNPLFGDLRTIIINGKEYFFGVDIATDLMYKRPRKAVIDHCKGVLNQDGGILTQDGEPIIPEGDVYRLIIKAGQQGNSKEIKKKADELEKWIFDEILPTLRKTGSYGKQKSTQEQITLLAQGTTELYERVEGLENKFTKFEQELPMLPDDADEVHDSLNKKVISLLGGKSSNAYRDKSLSKKVFMDAYRSLKYNFNVSRYKAIKRNQKAQALKIIAEYKPPFYLTEQIENANAQQSFNFESEGLHGK